MRQLKITKSITNRESASLDKYLQEIGREDLITVEEEVELAQRIRKGDRVALEKLTRDINLGITVTNPFIIKNHRLRGQDPEVMNMNAESYSPTMKRQRNYSISAEFIF